MSWIPHIVLTVLLIYTLHAVLYAVESTRTSLGADINILLQKLDSIRENLNELEKNQASILSELNHLRTQIADD